MASKAAIQACSFFLSRLAEEVKRFQEITYPGHHPGPKKWLSFVSGVIDTAKDYLALASNEPSETISTKILNDAEDLGDLAYKFLSHVSGADAKDIPHQVVSPFQRWAKALGITNTIFFRAEHLSNYELGWLNVSKLATNLSKPSQSLKDATASINWPLLRVTVPSHAMGMLPHFGVVAHELGHAVQEKIVCDLSSQVTLGTQTFERIRNRLKANGIVMTSEHQVRIGQILQSWINELKADAVGFLVAGPAFFFALFAFLELTGRRYGISGTHPPSDLRRRHLFGRLTSGAGSFHDVLQEDAGLTISGEINSPNLPLCPNPDQLFKEIRDRQNEVDSSIVVELIPYAEAIAPIIFDAAESFLKATSADLIYGPGDLHADILDFVAPLCAMIPPIERTDGVGGVKATSLASILNIGWVVLLAKLDDLPSPHQTTGSPIPKKLERLHELLLKAVELSESRRTWEENS